MDFQNWETGRWQKIRRIHHNWFQDIYPPVHALELKEFFGKLAMSQKLDEMSKCCQKDFLSVWKIKIFHLRLNFIFWRFLEMCTKGLRGIKLNDMIVKVWIKSISWEYDEYSEELNKRKMLKCSLLLAVLPLNRLDPKIFSSINPLENLNH